MPYNGMTPHMSGTTLSGQAREASVWFGWLAKVEDDVVHVRALSVLGKCRFWRGSMRSKVKS
jgi:hypothetical protein